MSTFELLSALVSQNLQERIQALRIVFIILSLFFGGGIIFFLYKTQFLKLAFLEDLRDFFTFKPLKINKFAKRWTEIIKRLEGANEAETKLLILETDEMLNGVLKKMGYSGETLGERLRNLTPTILPNLKEVLQIHKIRNNIVHDPSYRLPLEEAKKILAVYEQAFKNLHVF